MCECGEGEDKMMECLESYSYDCVGGRVGGEELFGRT